MVVCAQRLLIEMEDGVMEQERGDRQNLEAAAALKKRLIEAKEQATETGMGEGEGEGAREGQGGVDIPTAAVLTAHTEEQKEKQVQENMTDDERAALAVEAEVADQLKVMWERQDRVLSTVGDAEQAMEALALQLLSLEGAIQHRRGGGGAATNDGDGTAAQPLPVVLPLRPSTGKE